MLHLVPTPIGNLEDITLRALRLLREADGVLAEDTRTGGHLLRHYGIDTPLHAFHAHNEHKVVERWVEELRSGKRLALISDAGTPGISDPGFLLVRACIQANIPVECLPGATAMVPAVVVSGLPCHAFHFEGFLPHKKGRHMRLSFLAALPHTFVLYESPHRLMRTLEQLAEYCGAERPAAVCRELSKLFEDKQRGTLQELIAHFTQNPSTVRGEIVLVVGGGVETRFIASPPEA